MHFLSGQINVLSRHLTFSKGLLCYTNLKHICLKVFLSVCPELTNTLAIKQGKHPVLDKISLDPPVPNNVVSIIHLYINGVIMFYIFIVYSVYLHYLS